MEVNEKDEKSIVFLLGASLLGAAHTCICNANNESYSSLLFHACYQNDNTLNVLN